MARRANVHDRYFKSSLAEPGVAADFVAHYLPPEVAAALDLDTVVLCDGSFVDERLRGQYSDLLFSARLRAGGEALVYLLFEHKSKQARSSPLQLLRYSLSICERDMRADHTAPLKPIIPVLVYHGRNRWTAPTEFGELYAGPEVLRRYWPQFQFALLDLGARAEAEIVGGALLRVALLVLRAVFRSDLDEALPRIAALLQPLADRALARRRLFRLLFYVTAVNDKLTEDQVRLAAEAAEPEEGAEIMPTLAQQWMAQGRSEGLAEGLSQGLSKGFAQARAGLLDGIEVALDLKFGAAGMVLLPEIRGIADLTVLQKLFQAIRGATTLDDVRAAYGERAGA